MQLIHLFPTSIQMLLIMIISLIIMFIIITRDMIIIMNIPIQTGEECFMEIILILTGEIHSILTMVWVWVMVWVMVWIMVWFLVMKVTLIMVMAWVMVMEDYMVTIMEAIPVIMVVIIVVFMAVILVEDFMEVIWLKSAITIAPMGDRKDPAIFHPDGIAQ